MKNVISTAVGSRSVVFILLVLLLLTGLHAVDAKAAADIRTMLRDAMTALEKREIRKS